MCGSDARPTRGHGSEAVGFHLSDQRVPSQRRPQSSHSSKPRATFADRRSPTCVSCEIMRAWVWRIRPT